MAPLAVSVTSSLVSLMHRLVALELIIAAQAVDLRGGPEHARRRHRPRLRRRPRVRRQPDRRDRVERRRRGLATLVGDGQLARRVARVAGARPACPSTSRPGSDARGSAAARGRAARARSASSPATLTVAELAERRRDADQHRLPAARRSSSSTDSCSAGRTGRSRSERGWSRSGGPPRRRLRERLVEPARDVMEQLSRELGETAILTAPCGLEGIVLHVVETEQPLGPALLRAVPARADAPRRLRQDPRRIPRRPASASGCSRRSGRRRWPRPGADPRRGFAFTAGELDPGAAGLAVPILDRRGRIAAGLSVAGPIERSRPARRAYDRSWRRRRRRSSATYRAQGVNRAPFAPARVSGWIGRRARLERNDVRAPATGTDERANGPSVAVTVGRRLRGAVRSRNSCHRPRVGKHAEKGHDLDVPARPGGAQPRRAVERRLRARGDHGGAVRVPACRRCGSRCRSRW